MKLKGKNLVVMSIYRKGIFDSDSFCYTCENCGRAIVNTAEVKDVNLCLEGKGRRGRKASKGRRAP